MKQIIATLILVLVSAGLLAVVITGSQNKKTEELTVSPGPETIGVSTPINPENLVFYYGVTCPYCEDVEDWMTENGIEEKITIVKKEVYEDRDNAMELTQAAGSCGMDTASVGVPFLHTPQGECFIGSIDIINYLSGQVDLGNENEATESGKEIE